MCTTKHMHSDTMLAELPHGIEGGRTRIRNRYQPGISKFSAIWQSSHNDLGACDICYSLLLKLFFTKLEGYM